MRECENIVKKIILLLSVCLLALAGCGKTADQGPIEIEDPSEEVAAEEQAQTVERQGKTAVLTAEATLKNCYTALTDETGEVVWVTLPDDQPLQKGDMVLTLKDQGENVRVYVPTGDTAGALYGELPSDVLSEKEADLVQGNIANAANQTAYQEINGAPAETLTGYVKILAREGEWCKVQLLAGGDEREFWIPQESLSFSFDDTVTDREP